MTEQFFSQFSIIELIFVGIFILLIFILLIIDFLNYILIIKKKNTVSKNKQAVSVVITAQNDAEFLKNNLKYFLEQNYPVYEVIVVDDRSDDETSIIIGEYMLQYHNLRTTSIKVDSKFLHTRKLAINIGMKAAKYDIVLFSEGHCSPVSSNWIDVMQSAFKPETNVVIGCTKLKRDNTFLGNIVLLDRFIRTIRTISFAIRRNAFRGEGANVAYRKEAYFRNNCFAGNADTEVGYDTIPVKELSDGKNIEVVIHPDAHVYIDYIDVKKDWKHYKNLYYKSRRFYGKRLKAKLDIVPIMKFLLLLIFVLITIFFSNKIKLLILLIMVFYIIIRAINIKLLANILNERFLFINSLYMELIVGVVSIAQYLKSRIG